MANAAAAGEICESDEGARVESALSPLAALLGSTLLVSSGEALRSYPTHLGLQPPLLAQTLALSVSAVVEHFAPTCAYFLAQVALSLTEARWVSPKWLRVLINLLLSAGVVSAIYGSLVLYPSFAAYPQLAVPFVGLFGVVWWVRGSKRVGGGVPRDRRTRLLGFLPFALSLGGALIAQLANELIYPKQYPSLHLSLLQTTHLLLALAISRGPLGAFALATARPPNAVPSALFIALLIVAGGTAAGVSDLPDAVRPYHLSQSVVGRARGLFEPHSAEREVAEHFVPDDADALGRFRMQSQMPLLPEGFDLTRYNVLLLMSEATRFDATSLGDRESGSTPHLAEFADSGAFVFTRALAPSSGTLQSVSAILGMSYPSLLEIETWGKAWNGRLHAVDTAPELFKASGYDTFWISHNYRNCFRETMLGIDTRFVHSALIDGGGELDMYLDRSIADAALVALRERENSSVPFFGSVFFAGPHYPYLAHEPANYVRTGRERYRQEIRDVDLQIGRILAFLKASELGARTIVVYLADHGEEFGDHGWRFHGVTLYAESIHVPLLIGVPGLNGRRISEPTSTMYVLPWLLSHGTPSMRAAIEARLRQEIGPMLQATQGAVVSELLGHERMRSALIYPNEKFIYDFISGRHEAYRADQDVLDQNDRFGIDASLSETAERSVRAYRNVRASRRQFILRPSVRHAAEGPSP